MMMKLGLSIEIILNISSFLFQLWTVAGRLGVPGQAVQQLVVMGQEPRQGLNPSLKLEVEFAMDNPRRPKSVI